MSYLINEKPIDQCTLDDIRTIIGNSDYRENVHYEYKDCITFFTISREKQKDRQAAKAEFRKDICALANTEGGLFFVGITEDDGIPLEINGVSIPDMDTDRYESEIRKLLNTVQPKAPNIYVKFFLVENDKHLIIINVDHDGVYPYVFLEDGNNYRVFKRYGSDSITVSYEELRGMFNQSMILEKEIERFRRERIEFFRSQEDDNVHSYSQFAMLHIIPDTFLSRHNNKSLYIFDRKKDTLGKMFETVHCTSWPLPTVDGIRYMDNESKTECRLFNNMIAEAFVPVDKYSKQMDETKLQGRIFLNGKDLWNKTWMITNKYIEKMREKIETKKIYICISLIGCKNMITDYNRDNDSNLCCIDRNILLCMPAMLDNIQEDDKWGQRLKELELVFYMSLSFRLDEDFKKLFDELYP